MSPVGVYVRSPKVLSKLRNWVRGVKGEIIHHINKIRDDNSIFNLMVFKNNSSHIRFHKNQNAVKPSEIIFDGRKRVSLF